ncbi:hypothetical protein FRC11_012691 [Ceratobasidium sp. 423]|nr:hypothetical protein FRC11_012691 [Ceratobasidium sp. 423]
MEVLDWLFKHSRDPRLKSYVTQALAGLKSLSIELPTFLNNEAKNLDSYKDNSKLLSHLFDLGAHTADQLQMALTRNPSEDVPRGSSSTARLILAMGEIYPYALTWQIYRNTSETLQDKPLNIDIPNARKITGNIITAFGALDRLVWAESSPALRLSAYIHLVSAELKMLRYGLASLSVLKVKYTVPSSRHRAIEMQPTIDLPNLDRERLGERHSLALSRVALVIKSSLEHLTFKWDQEVQVAIGDLLFEATELVKQDKPKHGDTRGRDNSFSYPPNEDISIKIATENNTTRHVTCRRKAHNVELIEILIGLCWGDASMDILYPRDLHVAAFNLLVALWSAYQRERKPDEGVVGKIPLQGVKDEDETLFQNIDVFAHLRSTHSAIQLANATPEHPGPRVDQVMRSIDAALQATNRDVTTPVGGELLRQITSYILGTAPGCHVCLCSFTEGPGFSILAKLGQIEPDRAAAVGTVRALLAELHTAQLYVNEKAVQPLFEVIRLVCDSDGHQDDQGIDSFIDDALFQLQRLPESTSPFVSREAFSLIRVVFGKREGREEARSGSGSPTQVEIASLKRRVEQRAKELLEGVTTNASGGLDYQPAVPPTTIPDPQLNTTGSVPGDKANNLPQNYWNPAPLDTGNPSQSGSSDTNIASLKTDDKPSRVADDTSGSGHHHSLPAEAETRSETTDEGVTPTGKQGEEGW